MRALFLTCTIQGLLLGAAGSLGWQWLSYGVWRRRTLRRSLPAPNAWQTAADLAGDREVWPAVYYGSSGGIQAYRKATDRLPFTEIAEPGRWVGYADPGFQHIGAAQHLYGEEMAGSAQLTLWNTADGGESWDWVYRNKEDREEHGQQQ